MLKGAELDEILPRHYEGLERAYTSAGITPEGNGLAVGNYIRPGSRSTVVTIRASWVDRSATEHQKNSGPKPSFNFKGWIHDRKNVIVRYTSAAGDYRAFARRVGERVGVRAADWPENFRRIPWRALDGFVLENAHKGSFAAGADYITYMYGGAAGRDLEVRIQWEENGPGARRSTKSRYEPLTPRERGDEGIRITRTSRSHLAKVEVIASHGDSRGYADDRHRQAAERYAASYLGLLERGIARRRAATLSRDAITIGKPKPRESTKPTSRGSGSIRFLGRGVMIIRGGRRVRLATGDRIEKGDTLITSQTGSVRIAFDDPKAGPNGNGLLSVGPLSRVVIDVPPHRATRARPPKVTLQQGSLQYHRPHRPNAIQIHIETPQAIFGVTGTDVIVDAMEGVSALALASGTARVAVPRLAQGSFPVPRGHMVVVHEQAPEFGAPIEFWMVDPDFYFQTAAHISDGSRHALPEVMGPPAPGAVFFRFTGTLSDASLEPAYGHRRVPGTTGAPEFVWTPGLEHGFIRGAFAAKERGTWRVAPGSTWAEVDPEGLLRGRRR